MRHTKMPFCGRVFLLVSMLILGACSRSAEESAQTLPVAEEVTASTGIETASPVATVTSSLASTPESNLLGTPVPPQQPIDAVLLRGAPGGQIHYNILGFNATSGEFVDIVRVDQARGVRGYIQPNAWCPEGGRFLVFVESEGTVEAHLIDLERMAVENLPGIGGLHGFSGRLITQDVALWSPACDRLVFSGSDSAIYLGLYDLATHNTIRLTEASLRPNILFTPIGWTPDGDGIIYASNAEETERGQTMGIHPARIYRMTLSTGETTLLYRVETSLEGAVVSPTNPDLLALQVGNPGGAGWPFAWNVLLLNTATGEEEFMFDHGRPEVHFAFSPDGNTLAYSGEIEETATLCFRDILSGADSCSVDSRIRRGRWIQGISWLPDSQSVAVFYPLSGPELDSGDVILVSREGEFEGVLIPASDDPDLTTRGILTFSWNPSYQR